MLVSSSEPTLCLLEPHDIEENLLPDCMKVHRAHVEQVIHWAHTYLCQPHPALGREGAVCPYAEISLKRELFWLTVYPQPYPSLGEASAVVGRYREWFLELEPAEGKEAEYKAILILFPDLAPARAVAFIDALQAALKPEFIAEGLMIGQFHAGCEEPALWNPDFRPLRSTVPLLAIRTMVRTDGVFLTRDALSLTAYLRRFGHDVPGKIEPVVRAAALRLGLEYPGT